MNRLPIAVSLLAFCALASGCAALHLPSAQTAGTASKQLVFQNKTKEMVVTPDSKVDPVPVTDVADTHLQVLDGQGNRVMLDVAKTPVLIVAYWCPHCQRTLELLSTHRAQLGQLPVLVNTGFPAGTTLTEAKRVEAAEVKDLKLQNFTSYYALDTSFANRYAPKGYPTLLYPSATGVQSLNGEHVLSVWAQVLGGK
ncbi:hypothetical protein NZD89_17055 [Alicyclobacillus fastidiosus]|uniref:Thioredoxin domain-containing protein n=1 Tax=Alicyclobacillus fastidiosus TaxID=392011 RepID=A0ABY6ZB52_9BACL|nr:hypothetical protein [Alicyclobacillus fastidiosus]WAH40092.1 hypothetical protein NZD89_17055 [Alicyclobacillus fastidiosus]GMA61417.1 hypothetical protein GCM10025859_18570 [Alicyclobacillus fastidiosus]